jgi:hypothetical protein
MKLLPLLVILTSCGPSTKESATIRVEDKDGNVTTSEVEIVTIEGAKYLRWMGPERTYYYCPKVSPVAESSTKIP